jgi:Ca2+-binding EF-hand superfamily protein
LSRVSQHVRHEGLDLLRIFKIFSKQQGFITYDHLKKIFELIGFGLNESEFQLMVRFADESADGLIQAFEFAN